MRIYNKKIVISGGIVEVYSYSKKQIKREVREPKSANKSGGFDSADNDDTYKKKNGYRRKRLLRRLVNANADELTKFFTLTFEDNVKNLDFAYYELKKFKKRLKYYLGKNKVFKYVVVVEFQKRGAVHFHMICNLPYIKSKKLQQMWGNGFIKINKIDNVDNVGSYMVKYMGKNFEDERFEGRKRYNRSRNLKEPEEVLDKKRVAEILSQLPDQNIVFEKTFKNEHVGNVHYQQFNLNS